MVEAEGMVFNAVYADGSYGKIKLGKLVNKGGASGKIYLVEGRITQQLQ